MAGKTCACQKRKFSRCSFSVGGAPSAAAKEEATIDVEEVTMGGREVEDDGFLFFSRCFVLARLVLVFLTMDVRKRLL
jgi:hypothetical protein